MVLPVVFDSSHQQRCQVTVDGDLVKVEGAGSDEYAVGQYALSSGKYTWKVQELVLRNSVVISTFPPSLGDSHVAQRSILYWSQSEAPQGSQHQFQAVLGHGVSHGPTVP